MKGIFSEYGKKNVQDLGGGVKRTVLSFNEKIMSVEVRFEKGAIGSEHTHPHTQMSYVLSGKFEYSVEGESVIMNPGDSIVVPSGLVHGTVCLEAGALLDVFTPMREDFIAGPEY